MEKGTEVVAQNFVQKHSKNKITYLVLLNWILDSQEE